jgi:hypothetical protein
VRLCITVFCGLLTGDVPRVNGQLAVARAFGDHSLKTHLSSEPDVRHVPINSSIEFVILASDGLWKVCTITAYQSSPALILFLFMLHIHLMNVIPCILSFHPVLKKPSIG